MSEETKYSDLEKNRLEKMQRLREGGMEPYPSKVQRTHTSKEAVESFENAEKNGSTTPVTATLVGRIRSMRPMGKLVFAHIEDGAGSVQLFLRENLHSCPDRLSHGPH